MMDAREVDVVLIRSQDRLHRSMVELVPYIQLTSSTGIGLESIKGST